MIAALSAWHEDHEPAAAALESVTCLPAHAAVEAYSVLTRLPSGLAVPPAIASRTLAERFHDPALRLADEQLASLLRTLAEAGVHGGASYDAVVALEAGTHDEVLLTLDGRAQSTYRRLGTPFRVITA